jgi:hypothetical protein
MNVEIGAEAAQFPEKDYINDIAVAIEATKSYGTISLTSIFAQSVRFG